MEVHYDMANSPVRKSPFSFNDLWVIVRVRKVKFATYLKFATCENSGKIKELR